MLQSARADLASTRQRAAELEEACRARDQTKRFVMTPPRENLNTRRHRLSIDDQVQPWPEPSQPQIPKRIKRYDPNMTSTFCCITIHRRGITPRLMMIAFMFIATLISVITAYYTYPVPGNIIITKSNEEDTQNEHTKGMLDTLKPKIETNLKEYTTKTPPPTVMSLSGLRKMISKIHTKIEINKQLVEHMESIYIEYLLPHLKKDSKSLLPALYIHGERRKVDTVIGIPHVHRHKENHLLNTIDSLTEILKEEPKTSVMIIVLIAEADTSYMGHISFTLQKKFPDHVASGLLEIITPSASYYPNMDNMNPTPGDSRKRFTSKTKENLDTLYLMVLAQLKGYYYLMLQEDITVKPSFFTEINKFTRVMNKVSPNWIYIEFSNIVDVGKLFKSDEINPLAAYVQIFYKNMPIHWLLESYIKDRACSLNRFPKNCNLQKKYFRPQYNSPLFKHVGKDSSLNKNTPNINVSKNTIYNSMNRYQNDMNYQEPNGTDCAETNNSTMND